MIQAITVPQVPPFLTRPTVLRVRVCPPTIFHVSSQVWFNGHIYLSIPQVIYAHSVTTVLSRVTLPPPAYRVPTSTPQETPMPQTVFLVLQLCTVRARVTPSPPHRVQLATTALGASLHPPLLVTSVRRATTA